MADGCFFSKPEVVMSHAWIQICR